MISDNITNSINTKLGGLRTNNSFFYELVTLPQLYTQINCSMLIQSMPLDVQIQRVRSKNLNLRPHPALHQQYRPLWWNSRSDGDNPPPHNTVRVPGFILSLDQTYKNKKREKDRQREKRKCSSLGRLILFCLTVQAHPALIKGLKVKDRPHIEVRYKLVVMSLVVGRWDARRLVPSPWLRVRDSVNQSVVRIQADAG